MKNASCTWGDGPDVLLDIKDDTFILYEDPKYHPPPRGYYQHGYVTKGSMDLTADEALTLAFELTQAANSAKELECMCAEAGLSSMAEDKADMFVSECADIEMNDKGR